MKMITLGKTGLVVNKNGFGALPIQRISKDETAKILRKAYDNGINFYDTARFYTDSEEKLGYALKDVRSNIYIASKTMGTTVESFWRDLYASLEALQTDYLDLYQFHNPSFCPKLGDGTGLYEAMLEAKEKGFIRHIGITNHRLAVALESIECGLYETLQFPFNYLSIDAEFDLVKKCHDAGMGFISMKALSGGLITNSKVAYAFQNEYPVLPIWGIQRESELDEFLSYQDNEPELDEAIQKFIQADRAELMTDFCRGCGYCMPCPVGIEINNAARMSLLLRRSPAEQYFEEGWKEKMAKIHDCIECGACAAKCPYGLNTPQLLKDNLKDYEEVLGGKPM